MAMDKERKVVMMRDEKVDDIENQNRTISIYYATTLPDHLVFDEILTRLPAKIVARFKSVSKNWNSTISEPAFIRLHHHRAHTRSDGGNLAIYFSIDCGMYIEEVFFTAPYQGGFAVPHPSVGSRKHCASISTNGLVLQCFNNRFKPSKPVYINNPVTKEEDCLPSVENYIGYRGWNSIRVEFYSLGYDPLTGQYKVLAMCSLSDYDVDDYNDCEEEGGDIEYRLVIFVLRTEPSNWRKLVLDLDLPRPRRFVHSSYSFNDDCCVSGCCANGTLYWLIRRLDGDDKVTNGYEYILAFDVGMEKFRKLPLPAKLASSDDIMVSEVGDRLALARNKIDENGVPEVWIYKTGEWVKMKIEVPLPWKIKKNRISEVRAIHGGDKLLVIPRRETMTDVLRVYYYDNIRGKWFKVKLRGVPADYQFERDYYGTFTNRFKVSYEVSNNVETLFSPIACINWELE